MLHPWDGTTELLVVIHRQHAFLNNASPTRSRLSQSHTCQQSPRIALCNVARHEEVTRCLIHEFLSVWQLWRTVTGVPAREVLWPGYYSRCNSA